MRPDVRFLHGHRRGKDRTDSRIEIKPVYTEDDVEGLELELPGEYPFTAALHGHVPRSSVDDSTVRRVRFRRRQRFQYLLGRGQTGLSVAFDLPTQLGYDSDDAHRRAGRGG